MNSEMPAPPSLRTPLLTVGLLAVLVVGCASSPPPSKPSGNAPAPTKPLGIVFEEQITAGLLDGEKRVLWFYAPDPLPPQPGLVAIAPAGAPPFLGMRLGPGARPEHEPYVRAGYVVVAYSVDGAPPATESDEANLAAVLAFKKGWAGVSHGQVAIQAALRRWPNIDRTRVFAAGHSSAGRQALLLAAADPTVQAVIAYAAPTAAPNGPARQLVEVMSHADNTYASFIRHSTPINHIHQLSMPMFIFHTRDDQLVPFHETEAFVAAAKQRGRDVRFVAARGDHYRPMLQEGIPEAIEWMASVQVDPLHKEAGSTYALRRGLACPRGAGTSPLEWHHNFKVVAERGGLVLDGLEVATLEAMRAKLLKVRQIAELMHPGKPWGGFKFDTLLDRRLPISRVTEFLSMLDKAGAERLAVVVLAQTPSGPAYQTIDVVLSSSPDAKGIAVAHASSVEALLDMASKRASDGQPAKLILPKTM